MVKFGLYNKSENPNAHLAVLIEYKKFPEEFRSDQEKILRTYVGPTLPGKGKVPIRLEDLSANAVYNASSGYYKKAVKFSIETKGTVWERVLNEFKESRRKSTDTLAERLSITLENDENPAILEAVNYLFRRYGHNFSFSQSDASFNPNEF